MDHVPRERAGEVAFGTRIAWWIEVAPFDLSDKIVVAGFVLTNRVSPCHQIVVRDTAVATDMLLQ